MKAKNSISRRSYNLSVGGLKVLGDLWDDVEVGLDSPGRIRILRVLLRRPGECFTKYALERLTGLKPIDVRRDLRILVGLGWVKENPYNPKTYEINMNNEVVKIIAGFFRRLQGA